MTVEAGHHEIPGRRDGRGGAEALQRETRKCVNEPGHACENHDRAEAARQLETKERRLELPARDRPWNEPRQLAWSDDEENRRAQDRSGSFTPHNAAEWFPPARSSSKPGSRAWPPTLANPPTTTRQGANAAARLQGGAGQAPRHRGSHDPSGFA